MGPDVKSVALSLYISKLKFSLRLSHLALNKKPVKLIFVSTILTAVAFAVFMIPASRLVVKPLNLDTEWSPSQITVAFEVIGVDPIARTLEVDWYPALPADCSLNPLPIFADIYVDPGTLDTSSPSFSISAPYLPAYQFNSSQICYTFVTASFRTVSKLFADPNPVFNPDPGTSSTLQNYPVDVYYAKLYLYALDQNTSNSISLNITRTFGVVADFDVENVFSVPAAAVSPLLSLRITRSLATKLFVYAIATTDWLVAVAFLVICASTVIYPSQKIYSEIFVVPIGAVFALTTMRSNLPGAPAGFGATIDLYSILPVLVITALCSCYLLLFVLYRRLAETYGNDQPDPDTWYMSCYAKECRS